MQMDEDDRLVLRKLKKKIQSLISRQMGHYMAGQADKAIDKMLKRNSFPTFRDDPYDQMRKRDLVQVTKARIRRLTESNIASFTERPSVT